MGHLSFPAAAVTKVVCHIREDREIDTRGDMELRGVRTNLRALEMNACLRELAPGQAHWLQPLCPMGACVEAPSDANGSDLQARAAGQQNLCVSNELGRSMLEGKLEQRIDRVIAATQSQNTRRCSPLIGPPFLW